MSNTETRSDTMGTNIAKTRDHVDTIPGQWSDTEYWRVNGRMYWVGSRDIELHGRHEDGCPRMLHAQAPSACSFYNR